MKKNKTQKVSIVMGSQSDYKTMKFAEKTLKKIGISFETKIISAHRTPKRMYEYAYKAEKNNIAVIIAGAGGSAHLPGMISALTHLPVLRGFLREPFGQRGFLAIYNITNILFLPTFDSFFEYLRLRPRRMGFFNSF